VNLQFSSKWIFGTILGTIVILGILLSIVYNNKTPEYYLRVGESWLPNKDYSCYVAIVSDVEGDSYATGTEWQGDLTLAGSQGAGSKISPILSSHEIFSSDEFYQITKLTSEQAFGFISSFYLSSKLANVVYFNCYSSVEDGSEDFDIYGKVDIHTKKFNLYTGTMWGMINRGRYTDCYLCERENRMYIFPQSEVGQGFDPIVTFKLSDYIQYDQNDLYEPEFHDKVIEWLGNQ